MRTYNMFIYEGQKGVTSISGRGTNISKGREVYENVQKTMLKYQITIQEHTYFIFPLDINILESTQLNALLRT